MFFRMIHRVKLEYELSKKLKSDEHGNPAQSFQLIKRLITDWKNLQKDLSGPFEGISLINLFAIQNHF